MLTRRHFLATSTAALAAGAFWRIDAFSPAPSVQGRQRRPPPTPVTKDIRRNVGFFTASGGTIGWLINPAGVIVVDSQFADTAPLCIEEMLKRSGTSEIGTLINTHHHGDHTDGNSVFRPKTKQIIAHANVPKYLMSGYDREMEQRAKQNPPPETPAPAAPAAIDKTVSDTLAFEHGDERVSIKHYGPAHTGGDIVIHFERANVAHMGDLMFNRLHPVIDRPNGANIANWSEILKKVAGELPAETIYIFGHAGQKLDVTGSRADLLHHADYLTALLEYARSQVKAGKSRDEVVKSTEVIKGFEDYGPLISRPLGPAYDEVTAAK
jgi:cyclase